MRVAFAGVMVWMVGGRSALDVKARDEAVGNGGGAESSREALQPCGDLSVLFEEFGTGVCSRAGIAVLVLVEIKE